MVGCINKALMRPRKAVKESQVTTTMPASPATGKVVMLITNTTPQYTDN